MATSVGHESHALLFRTIFETVERATAWVSREGALPTLSRQWQAGKFSKDNGAVP